MDEHEQEPGSDGRLSPELSPSLAHDLRTPLTVIKGFAAMLESGAITKASVELSEIGEKILRAAERVEELTGELLAAVDQHPGD